MENITAETTVKAQAVSRKLGKRFRRSQIIRGRIKGWYNWTEGFECEQTSNGVVVRYRGSSSISSRQTFDNTSYINSIREYLISDGYEVIFNSKGNLFVCKKIGAK